MRLNFRRVRWANDASEAFFCGRAEMISAGRFMLVGFQSGASKGSKRGTAEINTAGSSNSNMASRNKTAGE